MTAVTLLTGLSAALSGQPWEQFLQQLKVKTLLQVPCKVPYLELSQEQLLILRFLCLPKDTCTASVPGHGTVGPDGVRLFKHRRFHG